MPRTVDRALRFVCLTSPRSEQGHLVPPEVVWRAMKSGGPWNLRGLRPEAREAAREAARRSGMSVGEWLNSVIQPGDDDDYGEPMRFADYDDEDDDGWRRRSALDTRESRPASRLPTSPRTASPRRRRRSAKSISSARPRVAREEFGEVHARLDRLTHQLERMARSTAPRLTGAPAPQPRERAPPPPQRQHRQSRADPWRAGHRSTMPSPRSPNVSARFMATTLRPPRSRRLRQ